MRHLLQKFSDSIWLVDGPPVRFIGIPFPTRMIIVQLRDGTLWINSPVSTPPDLLDEIRKLGPVKYLVAPTKLHVWRLDEWRKLFPEAEIWGPPRVPKSQKNIPFTGLLSNQSPSSWADDFDQLVFRGSILEEVFFLHRKSRTVILADFIQRHKPRDGQPVANAIKQMGGVLYPNGGVPLDIRISFAMKHDIAKQSLDKLLSWDFEKLIIAHGECIQNDAKSFIKNAFSGLMK